MDGAIRQRVLQINPWLVEAGTFAEEVSRRLPQPFVPRGFELGPPADLGNARLIVGPRQAGKSTIVWRHLRRRTPESVLFLNGEEELVRHWCKSAAGFIADLRAHFPSVEVVFLDEAQHLDEAGLFVKGLVDARRGLEIFVTGSSSFHLSARTRESLAGRAERFVLLPFSLAEVFAHERPAVPAARTVEERRKTQRMLVYGGYPRVWLGDQPRRILSNLVEAFVLRDASDRFRLRRPDALRKVLQLAAGQVGQMVNFAEWATHAGVSGPSVREYVDILEEAWILKLLPAFAGGRRREITSRPRVHFYDVGLRNELLNAFDDDLSRRTDRGALFEALAFSELAKTCPRDWTLHYWRAKGGAEVDFVLVRGDRRVAVEVKAGARTKLSRSARSFIEAYAPTHFVVLTGAAARHSAQREQLATTEVRYVDLATLAPCVAELTTRGGGGTNPTSD